MNAVQRGELLDSIEAYVGGGVAETLENIIESLGYDFDKLDRHTKAAIDSQFFTCDECNHSMPVDECAETEEGDGFLCKECADEK